MRFAIIRFRLLNDRCGLAKAHGNIANTYKALGDFDSAYEHAVAHLRLAQELNDKVSVVLFIFSNTYYLVEFFLAYVVVLRSSSHFYEL